MKNKTLTQVPLDISVYPRYTYPGKGMKGEELLKSILNFQKKLFMVTPRNLWLTKLLIIENMIRRLVFFPNSYSAREIWIFLIKPLRISARVRKDMSIENTPNKYTDKTIESIPNKMLMVVKQKIGVKRIKNEIKSNQIRFI